MPTPTIVPGAAQSIAANTVYALPVGPYRVQSDGVITFSSTVGGAYTTLTGANAAPGVLTNGGFIQSAAAPRLVVAKKINQLIKSYANLVGRSNPLSYYRLGEQGGNTIYDWIGQNHLTKDVGVTLGTTGPLGDGNFAATLDGTANGRGFTASGVNTWNGAAALSFEAWVYNTAWSATHECVVALGGLGLYMSVNNASVFMSIHNGTQRTCGAIPTLSINTWYHIAVTWEAGDKMRLYSNGVELVTNNPTIYTGTLGSSIDIFVGVLGPNLIPYSGIVDEVAIYLRKLTASEIRNHFGARLVS